MKKIFVPALAVILLGGTLTGSVQAQNTSDVKVTRIHVVSTPLPNGSIAQEVRVDWTNVGRKPIYGVQATIQPIGKGGKALPNAVSNYYLFIPRDNRRSPILPGQSFQQRPGYGLRLNTKYGLARAARVTITQVETTKPLH